MESDEAIAVIGMACRFPGAADTEAYWKLVRDGIEAIRFLPDEELRALGVPEALRNNPNYVPAVSALADADLFDAPFFGLSPAEAEILDPQQRVFLECAWHALEDAGYDSERFSGPIAVFGSSGIATYMLGMSNALDAASMALTYQAMLANDKDFLATRVSYKLNLRGPSVTVQTACSSSLVGLVLACESLINCQADMALVGGVAIRARTVPGYVYQEGMILSPDGHCRAFDANAKGTVGGSGAGVVVLKRLEDALEAGDDIRAVIRGWAINNDGAGKAAYTAPSAAGQSAVIAEALAMAGVEPNSIQYIEAHGTGTPLGDPIEITALTQAFGEVPNQDPFCAIGSVKTNIGHLDTAAGVASLIKTVLALQHRQIPPSLNFSKPNPQIDFARSPFFVNTKLTPWPAGEEARRAGVSSFGIGGTNAHVVLEEAPSRPPKGKSHDYQILPVSAKTPEALRQAVTNLAAHLEANEELSLGDVAHTLQVGRRAFPWRAAVVAEDGAKAAAALRALGEDEYVDATQATSAAFLLPGNAAFSSTLGAKLHAHYPAFRDAVERCLSLPQTEIAKDLRKRVLGQGGELAQDALAWPAAFVFEYALAQLWLTRGLKPSAMLGSGAGEYVAAVLADTLSLKDAMSLVVACEKLGVPRASTPEALESSEAERLRDWLGKAKLAAPSLRYISAVTGTWASEDVCQPEHWVQHLRGAAHLDEALGVLLENPGLVVAEIGVGDSLTRLVKARSGARSSAIVPSIPSPQSAEVALQLLHAAYGLWRAGAALEWSTLHEEKRRRIPLPTYPFERKRYWFETKSSAPAISPTEEARQDVRAMLEDTSVQEQREKLDRYLKETIAGLLRVPVDELADVNRSLVELGLDSLLAVELRNRVSDELRIKLSPTLFLEHPTVGQLVEALAGHLAAGSDGREAPSARAPVELPADIPLSYSQQIYWAISAVLPKGAQQDLVEVLRLRGPLNPEALHTAAQKVVDRHAALRLVFVGPLWKTVQRLRPQAEVGWHLEDVSQLDAQEQRTKIDAAMRRGFDLKNDAMLRLSLLKVAADEHVLVIACPHLVSDGWSLMNILRDLSLFYDAQIHGKSLTLPPLGTEFLEFILSERELAESPEGERMFAYWKEQLEGQNLILELPTDRQPTSEGSVAVYPLHFDEALAQGLRSLAQLHGVTLAATVLATLQVLISDYIGKGDFVMTALSARRLTPNLRDAVGNFADALPLRARVQPEWTFAEFLRRTSTTLVEAMAHDGFPSKLITDRLMPFPDPTRRPLSQLLFNWVDMSVFSTDKALSLTSTIATEHMERSTVYANDMFIIASQSGKEIAGELAYRQDVFDSATIDKLVRRWRSVCALAINDPEQKISMLTAALRS